MRNGFHARAAPGPGRGIRGRGLRRHGHQRAERRSHFSRLHEAEKGGGKKPSSSSNDCVPNTTVQTPNSTKNNLETCIVRCTNTHGLQSHGNQRPLKPVPG